MFTFLKVDTRSDLHGAPGGNHAKYLSYRLAHERMQGAIDAGFPLEAVAIAESLITDRLLSFANFHEAGFDPDKTTLVKAAQKVAKICRKTTNDELGAKLATKAEQWAADRNAVLHAIAKSSQGTGPKIAADGFVKHAHGVAQKGMALVKDIKAWHSKQLRVQKRHPHSLNILGHTQLKRTQRSAMRTNVARSGGQPGASVRAEPGGVL